MKKLKLDLDDFQVESFETTVENSQTKGTVFGYEPTFFTCGGGICTNFTCGDTCVRSCLGTCFTCGRTCLCG